MPLLHRRLHARRPATRHRGPRLRRPGRRGPAPPGPGQRGRRLPAPPQCPGRRCGQGRAAPGAGARGARRPPASRGEPRRRGPGRLPPGPWHRSRWRRRTRSTAASSPRRPLPKPGWLRRGPRRRDRAHGPGGPSLWICRQSRGWIGVRAPPKSPALLALGEGNCEYTGGGRSPEVSNRSRQKSGRSTVEFTDFVPDFVRAEQPRRPCTGPARRPAGRGRRASRRSRPCRPPGSVPGHRPSQPR